MYQLRILIVAAALWLIFLFGLARPDLVGMDLSPALYVLVLAAVLIIFFLPDIGAWHWAAVTVPGLLIYIGLGALGALGHSVLAWPETPIEIIVLLITQFLASTTSLVVAKLEQIMESVVIDASSSRILPAADGEEATNGELFRARRFSRPVAFLLLRLTDIPQLRSAPTDRFDLHSALQRSYLRARIGQLVESMVYRTDPLAWQGDNLVLCLPETNRGEAEQLAGQIHALVSMSLNIRLPIGVASFPDDGLIYADLVAAAGRQLVQGADARIPAPVAGRTVSREESSPARELPVELARIELGGNHGALALRQPPLTRVLVSLGLGALASWDELVQPFLSHAQATIRSETPYYDPDFWIKIGRAHV